MHRRDPHTKRLATLPRQAPVARGVADDACSAHHEQAALDVVAPALRILVVLHPQPVERAVRLTLPPNEAAERDRCELARVHAIGCEGEGGRVRPRGRRRWGRLRVWPCAGAADAQGRCMGVGGA